MGATHVPLAGDVLDALQRGDKLEAIRRLRESSGLGLKEAKEAIEQHLLGHPAHAPAARSSSRLPAAVVEALRQRKKVEAIRLLREQTGLGLKDAKDAVDAFQDAERTKNDGLASGAVSRLGSAVRWIALLAMAGFVVYYFLRGPG